MCAIKGTHMFSSPIGRIQFFLYSVAVFIAEHHVDEVFVKRKRDQADPDSLGRRPPALRKDR